MNAKTAKLIRRFSDKQLEEHYKEKTAEEFGIPADHPQKDKLAAVFNQRVKRHFYRQKKKIYNSLREKFRLSAKQQMREYLDSFELETPETPIPQEI